MIPIGDAMIFNHSDFCLSFVWTFFNFPDNSVRLLRTGIVGSDYGKTRDWSIVRYPEIYDNTEHPEVIFDKFDGGHQVALYGRAVSDPRYNSETRDYADGHRLVTSPITAVRDG